MNNDSTLPNHVSKRSLPVSGMEHGYANMPVTKAPGWFGGIAWDALLNGMATGLFMVAAICELAAPAVFARVSKMAYPVALVLLLVDLGMLVLDLGDSLRFHHMLRIFKPRSPMSVGTWCLTIFSLPLTVTTILSLLTEAGMDFEKTRIFAVVVGLLPAFGSAAYKGVLLSTNSQPGWKDARWMGCYLTNSAFLIGCAELLVLSAITKQIQAGAILSTAFVVLLMLNVIPLVLLFSNLQPTHARLYTHKQQWLVAMFIFITGIVVPLALTSFNCGLLNVLGAVTSLLVESWAIRFIFVKIPHAPLLKTRPSD